MVIKYILISYRKIFIHTILNLLIDTNFSIHFKNMHNLLLVTNGWFTTNLIYFLSTNKDIIILNLLRYQISYIFSTVKYAFIG